MNDRDEAVACVDRAAIRSQLERILDSDAFASAPQLRRFLQYVVEHRIRDDPSSLKEYALGVEVFDRGSDFDPCTDTIVRVNARRLRTRLADYYRGEGRRDSVLIEVPKGGYAARVRTRPDAAASSGGDGGLRCRKDDAMPGADCGIAAWLPAPRNALIGRDELVNELCGRLPSREIRLVTLTGAGGSGKTRLAIEAARQCVDKFPCGVVFIDLSSVNDGEAFMRAIARALGVLRTDGRALVDAIVAHLRRTVASPMLLVLDNLEQVAHEAPLIGTLLDASSQLTVLATSRVALRLYGEYEYVVEPLALPGRDPLPSLEELGNYAAVQLFVQRANAACAGYRLTDDNAAGIVELCCRLDGLPLAIELVAAHVRTMTPEAMLVRFTGHLDLPVRAARDLPARQTTLRRTVDWSHELLDPRERVLLRRLAVFAGGFTQEAVEAVANHADDLGLDIAEGIASLVARSLLQVLAGATGGERRFTILETIRAYALERLAASVEEQQVRRAHAAYMLVLAEEGNAELDLAQREAWLARCDRERENFRVALDGLLRRGDTDWALRLGQALFGYWERREHLVEGNLYLQSILERCSRDIDPAVRAKVEGYAATLLAFQGDFESANRRFRAMAEKYRELGDKRGLASAFNSLGVMSKHEGRYAKARGYFEQALAVCRELGDRREIAAASSNLAGTVRSEGDYARARELLKEARELFVESAQPVAAAWCVNHMADVARDEGCHAMAHDLYREAEKEFRALGDRWGTGRTLTDMGHLALIEGKLLEAGELFADALKIFGGLGHRRGVARLLDGCALLALRRGDKLCALRVAGASSGIRSMLELAHRKDEQSQLDALMASAWKENDAGSARQEWDAGRRMSYQQAIAYALDTLQAASPAPAA